MDKNNDDTEESYSVSDNKRGQFNNQNIVQFRDAVEASVEHFN